MFFWFGILKVIGTSPAEELVTKLFDLTLAPVMPIETFMPVFGLLECAIGIAWLFPKFTKIAFIGMLIHMSCTFIPLIMLKNETWQSFLTLTLTGQYIIKNIVLLAAAWYLKVTHELNNTVELNAYHKVKEELAHA